MNSEELLPRTLPQTGHMVEGLPDKKLDSVGWEADDVPSLSPELLHGVDVPKFQNEVRD